MHAEKNDDMVNCATELLFFKILILSINVTEGSGSFF